jgi:hypothetical protein
MILLNIFLVYFFNNYEFVNKNSLLFLFVRFLSYYFLLFLKFSLFLYLLICKIWKVSRILSIFCLYIFFEELWFMYLFSSIALCHFSLPFFIYNILFRIDQDMKAFNYQLSIIFLILLTNDFNISLKLFILLFVQIQMKMLRKSIG